MNIFNRLFNTTASPRQLQLLVWGTIFLINFFSLLPMDGLLQSFIYTILNTFFYAVIIYGNINFLFPRLYKQRSLGWYILASIVLLACLGFLKTWISQVIYNAWFAKKYYALTWQNTVYVTVGCVVVFILSFVFRIALAYFALKRQAQQIQVQKSLVELNLLKSQVQPHFLFNTLNNIYALASAQSEQTAPAVMKLSSIMRYVLTEARNDLVPLEKEIQFTSHYIELQKMRLTDKAVVDFTVRGEPIGRQIAPLLLLPFVENAFKYGISTRERSPIAILLEIKGDSLYFSICNHKYFNTLLRASDNTGIGISNTRRRLELFYEDRYSLDIQDKPNEFSVHLKIPV